jgi:hypothetical protein
VLDVPRRAIHHGLENRRELRGAASVQNVSDRRLGSGYEIGLVTLDFGLPFETIEYAGGCSIDRLDGLDSALASRPYPQGKPVLAQRMLTGIEIHGNEVLLDALVALEPVEASLQEPRRLRDWQFQF